MIENGKTKTSEDNKTPEARSLNEKGEDHLMTVDMDKLTNDFLSDQDSDKFLKEEKEIKFGKLKLCLQKEFEKD